MPERGLPVVLSDQPPNHWPPVQHLDRRPDSVIRWCCTWYGCDGRWRYEALVEHAAINASGHYMRAHAGRPMPEEMLYPTSKRGSVIYDIEEFA